MKDSQIQVFRVMTELQKEQFQDRIFTSPLLNEMSTVPRSHEQTESLLHWSQEFDSFSDIPEKAQVTLPLW